MQSVSPNPNSSDRILRIFKFSPRIRRHDTCSTAVPTTSNASECSLESEKFQFYHKSINKFCIFYSKSIIKNFIHDEPGNSTNCPRLTTISFYTLAAAAKHNCCRETSPSRCNHSISNKKILRLTFY